jgi:hypothetical protein
VAVLKQVAGQMQRVYATAGLSAVRRFMVDQITNPQLDFDAMLKMHSAAPFCMGQLAGSMKRTTASIRRSRSAIQHSCTWRSGQDSSCIWRPHAGCDPARRKK